MATGTISLANTGDEVLLLNRSDTTVDVVTYGAGFYAGVVAHSTVATGHSLERSPANPDMNNCAVDFVDRDPPTPGN